MQELTVRNWKILLAPEGLTGEWATSEEIGTHLGYSQPRKAISKIYTRHRQSFKDGVDTSVVKLVTEAGLRESRVFSERGTLKLIRFSDTEKADEIMDEVFDVFLEAKNGGGEHPMITSAKRALHLAEQYCRLESEQQKMAQLQQHLADRQNRHADNIKALEAKTEAYIGGSQFFTILAFARLVGKKVDVKDAAALGRRAANESKRRGISIKNVRDERFGRVNSYHEEVLKTVFN